MLFVHSGTTEARLCLLLISLQLLVTRSVEGLVISWSLLMSLLLRPYNVILLPALYLCSHTVSRTLDTHTSTYVSAALHHWLGAVFFFYQVSFLLFLGLDINTRMLLKVLSVIVKSVSNLIRFNKVKVAKQS